MRPSSKVTAVVQFLNPPPEFEMAAAAPDGDPYPLYNTTFTLHRLSPLYVGRDAPLDNAALLPYARRFRDILVGDVLRGVRVGLGSDEDVLARIGALQAVTWKVLVEEDAWDITANDESRVDDPIVFSPGKGIYVTVAYEKATYVAILLRNQKAPRDGPPGFQHMPLLLTRMPSSLRDTFTEFLESSFDARISVLRLGRSHLPSTLESYVQNCLGGEDDEDASLEERNGTLKRILKDVQVVVGFDLPSGNTPLKTIDIFIARDDLPRLLQSGSKIHTKVLAKEEPKRPFMDALTLYVHTHLALNLRHEDVNILRVACGAFVLGAEGKVKLTEPIASGAENIQGHATAILIDELIRLAEGQIMSKAGEGR
jgi:Kinetochore complex Sim4 subunit Fta1